MLRWEELALIKTLARSIREYKWASLLSPICMVGEVTMEIFIPLVLEKLLEFGIDAGNMDMVWKYGLQLAACALCSLAFGVASAFFAAYASTALPGICATICLPGYRPTTLPISTNFPHPASSQDLPPMWPPCR